MNAPAVRSTTAAAPLNPADPFIVNTTRTAPSLRDGSSVTEEQRRMLLRVSEAGGNVHRNAIPPRILAVLLSARLLERYGADRVELTALAVQFLETSDAERTDLPDETSGS